MARKERPVKRTPVQNGMESKAETGRERTAARTRFRSTKYNFFGV
jgi:hypothetical protein